MLFVYAEYYDDEDDDFIYINDIQWLNMKSGITKSSSINLPFEYYVHALISNVDDNDKYDVIVSGYCRQYQILLLSIPFEVITMITTFCIKEYVHIVQPESGEHCKIALENIVH